MSSLNIRGAMQSYGKSSIQAEIESASPHRLIQMLLQGAMDKVAMAKGSVDRNEYELKSQHISTAVSIVNGLRMGLNKEQGGDLAENLDSLYEYMSGRLAEANNTNDTKYLDEVNTLLADIKAGWDGISNQVNQVKNSNTGTVAAHA